jgi:DNA repair photolyase
VRWDSLRATEDSSAARATPPLPLALPGAFARTFDTPGFAGMTFYEVRAKSIINRVPAQSRMSFDWTINPYRGCTHACTYCMSGDTPILMADGRPRRLADVRVDDEIYGTLQVGSGRHLVVQRVMAHWSTVKQAYRVTLEDGTQLVSSDDHRFLSSGGWKHVAGRRPHLTTGSKLVGTGHFATPPEDSEEYRRGYLCGVIRGERQHEGRRGDREALERTRDYLSGFGAAVAGHVVDAVTDLIRVPSAPCTGWHEGFLAGLFDATGSYDPDGLHVRTADEEILRSARGSLRQLGFAALVEDCEGVGGPATLQIIGDLSEQLRFLQTVDPAITRKRTLDGVAVHSDPKLRVVSVEPLGAELPLVDITTQTGDFIADGVVSHNCFARNTHTYLDLDAGHDFDSRVVVKVNAGELLRKELAAPRWRGEHIAMGTNVDCYQRAEGRYRLMREIIAALRDVANPFSILTKGTLMTRDVDLLTQAAEVTNVGLSMSIGFVNETLWRSVEPGTPSPRRRLDAVRQFADAGFDVGVLMAPILPGLTDTDESIEATVRAIAAAGAASVVPLSLHLRPGAREWYLTWLAREHRELLPLYRELYGRKAYLGSAYQRDVAARVRMAARRYGLRSGGSNETRPATTPPAAETPPPEQLTIL